jgi:hypothetical protein
MLYKASVKVTLQAYTLIQFTHYQEHEPRLRQSPEIQVAQSLRGDHIRAFGRGSVRSEYTFSRVVEHAHRDAAIAAMQDFAELWPKLHGTTTIITNTDPNGHTLANSAISSVDCHLNNFLTYHTITIVGGLWTTVAP